MKHYLQISAVSLLLIGWSLNLNAQNDNYIPELGISSGAFTNFPANENYLKDNMSVFFITPYVRAGRHEFSAGMTYSLKREALYFHDNDIFPRPGAIAGYKFYLFNIYGRENMFIHYSFQYLRFKGHYDTYYGSSYGPYKFAETDMYINNVIGLGYNLFFDNNARFGFFYFLDYVISQSSYHNDWNNNQWTMGWSWNQLSTGFGLTFKLTPLKKVPKKQKDKTEAAPSTDK